MGRRGHGVLILIVQRAGDYILAWAELVEEKAQKMFGGTAASTKSTLVKRGPKDRAEQTGDTVDPPSKRVKVEGGTSSLDHDVKRSFEKGAVAKVSYYFGIRHNKGI